MHFNLLQWLNNLGIRDKLFILISIPILSVLFFAVSGVSEKYQQYNNSINTQNFLEAVYSLDNLIYELQIERGLSTNLIKNNPIYSQSKIRSQRKRTDNALDIFHQQQKTFDIGQLSPTINNELINLNQLIARLPTIRAAIDKKNFDNVINNYSSINSHAINFIQHLSQLTTHNKLAQLGDAYTNLLWLQERAGQERAALMQASITGQMDSKNFRKIIAYIEAQKNSLKNFNIKTPDMYRNLLQLKLSDPVNKKVEGFRDAVLNQVIRNELLNELQTLIGYGGLIHDYKNYVIRGEKSYLEYFKRAKHDVKDVINRYKTSPGIHQEDLLHLRTIEETLDNYFDFLEKATGYHQQGYSIQEIEKLVKIDDSPAQQAIIHLRKGWSEIDSASWWESATKRIDLIKKVNDQVKVEILRLAAENTQSAILLLGIYLVVTLVTILFSFVFGVYLMHRLIGELKNISNNIRRMFQEKRFDQQLAVSGNDEIGVVANTFNQLIDERLKFESALHLSYTVYANAKEAIMIAGTDKQVQMANPAFTQISGYKEEEIIDKDFLYLSCDLKSDHSFDSILDKLQRDFYWEGEIWNKKPGGEYYLVWLSVNVVRDAKDTIQQYIAMFTDITERKQYEDDIWRQANYDALTSLPNRKLCMFQLSHDLMSANRSKTEVALLFIDLDGFKLINDTLGHSIGDELLIEIASRLSGTTRESDMISRLGGDEFVVILNDIKETSDIEIVSRKILNEISLPVTLSNNSETFTTASMGIALYPNDGRDVETLMKHADTAMYQSKKLGRNKITFYKNEMNQAMVQHMTIDRELRKAISDNQLLLHYQPIIELKTGRILGAEALIRWQHPTLGLVSPDKFISIAEGTGLIVPIGEWVIMTAAHQASEWNKISKQSLKIAINLSSRQCADKEHCIVEFLKKTYSEAQLKPGMLQIEITESLLMDGSAETVHTLNQIHDLGIGISLDDFGTGYSSLSYLKHFPISTLKIDRTFVKDSITSKKDAQLVKAMIMMSKSLDLDVVGEGIENVGHLSFLKNLGCQAGQGYYFSRPLTAEAFGVYLQEESVMTILPNTETSEDEHLLTYSTQNTG